MRSQLVKSFNKIIICLLLILIVSCDRPSSTFPTNKSNNSSQLIESFGQRYETIDGQRHILVISSDELELQENGENIVCKYSKQDNNLRVITNVLGTSRALYFQIHPEGISDDRNQMYYNPSALIEAKKAALLAEERAEEQARIDAQKQEQERIRIQEMTAQSKVVSKIINESPVICILTPGSGYNFHEITKTVITDVSVTFSGERYWFSWSESESSIKPYKMTYWYGDITNFELINEVFPFQARYPQGPVLYIKGPNVRLFFKDSEKNLFVNELINAWQLWKDKYSDIINAN